MTKQKITSRWLNIVGIRMRSRISNSARDFDLVMWSTMTSNVSYALVSQGISTSGPNSLADMESPFADLDPLPNFPYKHRLYHIR